MPAKHGNTSNMFAHLRDHPVQFREIKVSLLLISVLNINYLKDKMLKLCALLFPFAMLRARTPRAMLKFVSRILTTKMQ